MSIDLASKFNYNICMQDTIKWIATAILIVGSFVNSMGYYPLGPVILVVGGCFWLQVAIKMQDKPLIVTNAVMIMAGGLPLLYRFFAESAAKFIQPVIMYLT
jgi:hypothetical protein